MHSTRASILEAFEFRGSRIESRSSSFEGLSTYICTVLYQPAVNYALVYIQKKKPVLFLCFNVHTLKMYRQLAIVSLTDEDSPLTCNNTASIDSIAKEVLLVKLKVDKETKFR